MIELLGWLGTALVVLSYLQKNESRLRRLSLVTSVALIVFNAVIGVWSNVALEVALVVINVVRLQRADAALPLANAADYGSWKTNLQST